MFEVEHLIYNQWCSQYVSDKTLKTLEFLRYGSLLRNSKWTLMREAISAEFQDL